MAVYECTKPTREMLQMKASELRAYLAEEYDLGGMNIPLEVNSISELMDFYKLTPKELERIEKAIKRQGIYVSDRFVIRSINRRPWKDG